MASMVRSDLGEQRQNSFVGLREAAGIGFTDGPCEIMPDIFSAHFLGSIVFDYIELLVAHQIPEIPFAYAQGALLRQVASGPRQQNQPDMTLSLPKYVS
jgi:hypothetical protein